MNFVSFAYLYLFLIVLVGRLTFGARKTGAPYHGFLLAASLLFYAWHIPAYLFILLTTTAVDFLAARAIAATALPARRKAYLTLSLSIDLGILAFFKYYGFFLDTLAQAGGRPLLESLHLHALGLALPLGISFYTFQSMSYTIDVYRGRLKPVASYGRFLLFVSLFPQLVSGPIVRAAELLPQFPRIRRPHWRTWSQGFYLIILGFFLKMVVADNLASYVNGHWEAGARPDQPATVPILLAVLFAGQIFGDFAGYSSIAIGTGVLLGFRLPENFNNPYLASSFRGFWTRWHITLSRWLRDYLYIPLGGGRGGRLRTFLNLMVVMLLGGLWHGAAFPFILWGGLHGLGLVIEHLLGIRPERSGSPGWRVLWTPVVQGGVLAGWILFRSSDLTQAGAFFANIAGGGLDGPETRVLVRALVFLAPVVLMHLRGFLVERGWFSRPGPLEKAFWAGTMLYLTLTCYGKVNEFLYFQF